jgi:hypothetical protein
VDGWRFASKTVMNSRRDSLLSFDQPFLSFVTKFKNLSNLIENIDWTLSSFGR